MKLNNIKDSFENRKIEPSASAWDQLASRLDQKDKKDKKPVIYWLSAIAAAVVVGLVLYPFFSSDMNRIEKHNQLVIEENKPPVEAADSQNKEAIQQELLTTHKEAEIALEEGWKINKEASSAKTLSKNEAITNDYKVKAFKNTLITNPGITQTGIAVNDKETTPGTYYPKDNSIDPAIANAITQNKTQTLTAEQEMELLLSKALKYASINEVAVEEVNIDRLLRETEWDIEADRRIKINNTIFDQLGKLKSEAFALVGANK
jgi:uncharacterized membrane protein